MANLDEILKVEGGLHGWPLFHRPFSDFFFKIGSDKKVKQAKSIRKKFYDFSYIFFSSDSNFFHANSCKLVYFCTKHKYIVYNCMNVFFHSVFFHWICFWSQKWSKMINKKVASLSWTCLFIKLVMNDLFLACLHKIYRNTIMK